MVLAYFRYNLNKCLQTVKSQKPSSVFYTISKRLSCTHSPQNKTALNLTVQFYVSLNVHLGIILVNNQLDALFFNEFIISPLYMFRALSAHHQES